MTRAFLPDMIEKKAGHFLNVASASGLIGLPQGSTYAASKWACIGFSESIRLEMAALGHKDIKVTVLAPSYIRTGMFDGVTAPMLTPFLDPEKFVDTAYSAFKKDRIFVLEPFMVKVTPALKAFLPAPVFDVVGKLFGVTRSMNEWKGHA
jgi:short-subunit dehydrogenase